MSLPNPPLPVRTVAYVRQYSLSSKDGDDKKAKDTAMEDLFPNRAIPPIPSPVNISELEGSYYDPGYGKMNFKVASHPDSNKEGEQVLQAERRDTFVACLVQLQHASGNFWLVSLSFLDFGDEALSVNFRAEFEMGEDGKATALVIDYSNPKLGLEDGKVRFERIEGAE